MLSRLENMYEHRDPILNQNLRLMGHRLVLPNDDREQDRLDILHHVFRLTLGGALCRTKLGILLHLSR